MDLSSTGCEFFRGGVEYVSSFFSGTNKWFVSPLRWFSGCVLHAGVVILGLNFDYMIPILHD